MKAEIYSKQYGVTDEQFIKKASSLDLRGVESLVLKDISLKFKGYGHYHIIATIEINNSELSLIKTTTNMQLIDAWKSGINDNYENGDDGFDDWNEVVESILSLIEIDSHFNYAENEQ